MADWLSFPSAGDYRKRYAWLKRTLTKDATYGQQVETWANSGQVFFGCFEEVSAAEKMAFGVRGAEVDGRIRIRNWPRIQFNDRLQDEETGELWICDGVTRKPDELLIYGHQFR